MTPEEILAALGEYAEELSGFLARFTRDRSGIHIDRQDNYRLRTVVTELIDLLRDHVPGSAQHIRMLANSYNEGMGNMYSSASSACVEEIRAVTLAVVTRIERNKNLFAESTGKVSVAESSQRLLDELDQTVLRFHAVAVQLRDRHSSRPTLDVNDEYDVQDLMHALLRLHFDDVRAEEWVPS